MQICHGYASTPPDARAPKHAWWQFKALEHAGVQFINGKKPGGEHDVKGLQRLRWKIR